MCTYVFINAQQLQTNESEANHKNNPTAKPIKIRSYSPTLLSCGKNNIKYNVDADLQSTDISIKKTSCQ